MATAAAPRVYKNFINGEWVDSRGGSAHENRNPANTDALVGMSLVYGYSVYVEAVEGGRVVIEPLP